MVLEIFSPICRCLNFLKETFKGNFSELYKYVRFWLVNDYVSVTTHREAKTPTNGTTMEIN